jgi:XTP/dITP diphosphohydrolase
VSGERVRKLLIATTNRGKVAEFRRLFAELPELELISLAEIADSIAVPQVIEDGATFEANARKKALEIAAATRMLVLSDDSGLEVDALSGRPGVHSARYAGERASDADNNLKLIHELRDVPDAQRSARYRVVLALADLDGPLGAHVHIEHGVCEGRIRRAPSGHNGFGYDPYFEPLGHAVTMAELTPEQKNSISHRARAAAGMRRFLKDYAVRARAL